MNIGNCGCRGTKTGQRVDVPLDLKIPIYWIAAWDFALSDYSHFATCSVLFCPLVPVVFVLCYSSLPDILLSGFLSDPSTTATTGFLLPEQRRELKSCKIVVWLNVWQCFN